MSVIERRTDNSYSLQQVLVCLILGGLLEGLGMLLILMTYLFPAVNPLNLVNLPLPETTLYIAGGVLIVFSFPFFITGILRQRKRCTQP